MCKTYNTIGSLTTLKLHLKENNIHDFKSLKEVIDFQNAYTINRQQLIFQHENLIEQEKSMLNIDLEQLDIAIARQRQLSEQRLIKEIDKLKQQLSISKSNTPTNFFQKLVNDFKHWNYKRKIVYKQNSYESDVNMTISDLVEDYQVKNNRYQFITTEFNEAVKQSAQHSLSELERKNSTISKVTNFIYGALGEQKVVKTLETLTDDYFLINDFNVSFSPALYNKQENDYIKSVQIDHILVGPSGIFIIETKNWSEKSLESLSLRSPVEQIRRTSYALFYLLNNEVSN